MLFSKRKALPHQVKIKGASAFHRSKYCERTKDYAVDSFAGISFFTPILAANELFIAGMPYEVCLKSRLMGIGFGLAINRPYGIFRNWCMGFCGVGPDSSSLRKFIADTAAVSTFMAPISSFMYYAAGATLKEALVAVPSGIALGFLVGRPYGKWIDFVRKKFGGRPVLEE